MNVLPSAVHDQYLDYVMPWGRHAGKKLRNIPLSYLAELKVQLRLELTGAQFVMPEKEELFMYLVGFFEIAPSYRGELK